MKVFASDYDGTLKVNGEVSIRNRNAIQSWVENGNTFGLVTGRSVESTLQEIEKYKLPVSFIICNNGGVIYDQKMQLLKLFEIEYEVALSLIREIRTWNCNSFVLNNGWYRAKEIVNSEKEDYKYGSYSFEYSVERIIQERHIAQIIISINDIEQGKQIAEDINERYKGKVSAFVNMNCVDIVPYGVNKAKGLHYIEEYYKYNHDDIYCMGDAYNDLDMLKAYTSATLVHAFEDIKKEINEIYEDVASFLEKHCDSR